MTTVLSFRVDKAEAALIRAVASRRNARLSDYLRSEVLPAAARSVASRTAR